MTGKKRSPSITSMTAVELGTCDVVHVVSQEEAEKAAAVVCCRTGLPSHFADNVTGACAHCGHAIFFRPHVPKSPPKICIECAMDLGRGGRA